MATSAKLRLPQNTFLCVRVHVSLEGDSADIPHFPVGLKDVKWPEGGQLGKALLGYRFASSSLNFVVSHGCHEHVLSQLIPIGVVARAIDIVSERLL